MYADSEQCADWQAWVGRTHEQRDLVTPMPLAGLAALLDRDGDVASGFAAPLLSHWLFFAPLEHQSRLGEDGHPLRGSFLPPITLPRRMWAGSRLRFHAPIAVDDEILRQSRIDSVSVKNGRSGTLAFVTVHHTIHTEQRHVVTEEQDIVYREATMTRTASAQPVSAPANETFSRQVLPDPALLFRHSALTFNAHRIHYDHPYATEVEHYPGLVVHGPLTATLLLDLLTQQHPGIRVRSYAFRAISPLYANRPFTVCGRWDNAHSVTLWTRGPEGELTMRAHADVG